MRVQIQHLELKQELLFRTFAWFLSCSVDLVKDQLVFGVTLHLLPLSGVLWSRISQQVPLLGSSATGWTAAMLTSFSPIPKSSSACVKWRCMDRAWIRTEDIKTCNIQITNWNYIFIIWKKNKNRICREATICNESCFLFHCTCLYRYVWQCCFFKYNNFLYAITLEIFWKTDCLVLFTI